MAGAANEAWENATSIHDELAGIACTLISSESFKKFIGRLACHKQAVSLSRRMKGLADE
jgi:hypothetical protein